MNRGDSGESNLKKTLYTLSCRKNENLKASSVTLLTRYHYAIRHAIAISRYPVVGRLLSAIARNKIESILPRYMVKNE